MQSVVGVAMVPEAILEKLEPMLLPYNYVVFKLNSFFTCNVCRSVIHVLDLTMIYNNYQQFILAITNFNTSSVRLVAP